MFHDDYQAEIDAYENDYATEWFQRPDAPEPAADDVTDEEIPF